MTVSYSAGKHTFRTLLLRWRGSLWRSVGLELFVWLIFYFAISCVYRFMLDDEEKRKFERIVAIFDKATGYIPVQFTLGFFVAAVYSRNWQEFKLLYSPAKLTQYIALAIPGKDRELVMLRRTLARFVNLSLVLGWRFLSTRVKRRFPTDQHLVRTGLMTQLEHDIIEKSHVSEQEHYLLPVIWSLKHLAQAKAKNIVDPINFRRITEEMANMKDGMRKLHNYSWMCTPLVYTQVVTIAVYGYFTLALMSRQFTVIDPLGETKEPLDWVVPIFTVLQVMEWPFESKGPEFYLEFMFYVGWLKVGEQLFNPFGTDDADFEMNLMIDRNIETSFVTVDRVVYIDHEPVDTFAGQNSFDIILPRTKATLLVPDIVCPTSGSSVVIKPEDMEIVVPKATEPETNNNEIIKKQK